MSGADGTFEIDPRQFLAPEDEADDRPAIRTCRSCGAPISEASLAFDPSQRFCDRHAASAGA